MKFVLEIELGPELTFGALANQMRQIADSLPSHPMPRDVPVHGDTYEHSADGKVLAKWYLSFGPYARDPMVMLLSNDDEIKP